MTVRALVLVGLAPSVAALAHPLGNFTTNRYAALEVAPSAVRVAYVVDMAELPAYREMRVLDTDGDGRVAPGDRDAWTARQAAAIARGLELTHDGARLDLVPVMTALEIEPGAGGLPTIRLDVGYRAALPAPRGELVFRDTAFGGRPGWQEVVATGAAGVTLTSATVPAVDVSRRLRAYPDDLMQAPPLVSEARLTLAPAGAPAAAGVAPAPARGGAERAGDGLTALLTDPAPLAPWTVVTSLLFAAVLGAFHALAPGHGKTIVGAYLVGARGTTRHAVYLGAVVTLTHTLGVYALGLGTLLASTWIVPDRLYPWIAVLSGLLVLAVGASLVTSRLRHAHHHHHDDPHGHHGRDGAHRHDHVHHHGHTHLPPGDTPPTLRSLIALGISGGLAPCPSALVVMLGAIALDRTAFGLALIVAFSVGLAGALTAVGIALVHARGLFERLPLGGRVARYVPVASAVVVSLAGAAIVVEALSQMGLVPS